MSELLEKCSQDEVLAEIISAPKADPDEQATMLLIARMYNNETPLADMTAHLMASRRQRAVTIIKGGDIYSAGLERFL